MQHEAWHEKLHQERIRHGWTQKELADKIGSSSKTVGRWERGGQLPSLFFQQKLTKVLGKDAETLGFLPEPRTAPDKVGLIQSDILRAFPLQVFSGKMIGEKLPTSMVLRTRARAGRDNALDG